jgi:DNA polymerase-3 subunit beta
VPRRHKPGSLTLAGKKLYEIVKSLPEPTFASPKTRGGVKVAADRFDSRMQTLPTRDFPTLPNGGQPDRRSGQRAEGDGRQDAVRDHRRGHALFLNGAQFVLRADSMSLVATDGHRLALVTSARTGDGKTARKCKAILPEEDAGRTRTAAGRRRRRHRYERARTTCFFEVGGRS